ncbi:hypothetical protein D3C84_1005230 [compost metagenome]
MALAGYFEGLTRHHLYRQSVSHAEALQQISAASGTRFDPSVVLAFIEAADSFAEIAQRLADDAASIRCELQRLDESLGESIELTLPAS